MSYPNQLMCSAAFSSLVVDPDKQIRPCCVWSGPNWGNIRTSTIDQILNHPARKKLQEDMKNGVLNTGCSYCINSEKTTGNSVRLEAYGAIQASDNITYLEYNGSNICNLACVMCGPSFSSTWVEFEKKHKIKTNNHIPLLDKKIHGPDIKFSENFFKTLNLSALSILTLKGGEPFLNKENILLLDHLKTLDVLKNIAISITTNATVLNDQILDLLKLAKSVSVTISKDGPNDINRWIRWNDSNPELSSDLNIKSNIKKILTLPNIKILKNTCSVQVYNIFHLDEHWQWWEKEIVPLSTAVQPIKKFDYFVHTENYNLRVLTDNTRHNLIEKYKSMNVPVLYDNIISFLNLPYLGNHLHNAFVLYTLKTDRTRDTRILNIVPDLKDELSKLL